MDFIPAGYINIRNALDGILRATHGDGWGQQEIHLEKDKVRVAGAFDENDLPIEGQCFAASSSSMLPTASSQKSDPVPTG